MNSDIEKYYETYFSLFITDGWKQFVKETQEAIELLDLSQSKSWEEFIEYKTKLNSLKTLGMFEEVIKTNYDRLHLEPTEYQDD